MSDPYAEPVSVVVLAKESGHSKTRLGLDRAAAGGNAIRLASTTLTAVLQARCVAAVSVVTSDLDISSDACRRGVSVVPEARPLGMNKASELGWRAAVAARPTSPVGIMVADLPYLRAEDWP